MNFKLRCRDRADAIVTANLKHFPKREIARLHIDVLHPDDVIVDSVDFDTPKARVAFRERLARKKSPPMSIIDLVRQVRKAGLPLLAEWLSEDSVRAILE